MTIGIGDRSFRVNANIGNADETEEGRASPARIIVAGEIECRIGEIVR